eukprot:COSAG03_NODE_2614_length_2593_cov_3.733761_2_plen_92_part_00
MLIPGYAARFRLALCWELAGQTAVQTHPRGRLRFGAAMCRSRRLRELPTALSLGLVWRPRRRHRRSLGREVWECPPIAQHLPRNPRNPRHH